MEDRWHAPPQIVAVEQPVSIAVAIDSVEENTTFRDTERRSPQRDDVCKGAALAR